MRCISSIVIVALLILLGVGVYVRLGVYDIGADEPHWPVTIYFINHLRDYSIAARDGNEVAPNLDNPAMIADGAVHFSKNCAGCHLAPGMSTNKLRVGLYPTPPKIGQKGIDDPAEAFWYIKHGIKMTGMPAWGKSISDQEIWSMVAFLRKVPQMSVAQYQRLSASAAMPTPAATSPLH
jgi:mono/diheme cytochrome c family protein